MAFDSNYFEGVGIGEIDRGIGDVYGVVAKGLAEEYYQGFLRDRRCGGIFVYGPMMEGFSSVLEDALDGYAASHSLPFSPAVMRMHNFEKGICSEFMRQGWFCIPASYEGLSALFYSFSD